MVATIESEGDVEEDSDDVGEEGFSTLAPLVPLLLLLLPGMIFKSRSSHQSSSVTWLADMPQFTNHSLFFSGTKNWALGCCLTMRIIVGWSIWS